MSFARLWRVWSRQQGRPGSIWGRWTGPRTPETSILGGPEPRFSSRFSIVLPFEFAFDFSMIFRSSLQPMPYRSWIDETSSNPDFVRPVEVFQGFFDIAHPCRHDESVVEQSTIIQRFWGRFSMIVALNSCSLGRSFVFSFDRVRVQRLLSTFASRAF